VQKYAAYCLDGTANGYFFRKSSAQPHEDGLLRCDWFLIPLAYNSWVIFLEGGGVCAEPVDCEIRKKSHLGSSNYWAASFSDDVRTISDDAKVNPFYNWNHVFFPYCT
jgi:hypothetical protein